LFIAEATSYSWQTHPLKIEFRAANHKMCSNGVTQCVMTDKYFPRDILNIIAGELTPEERESFRVVHPNLSVIRPAYGPFDRAVYATRDNVAMLELSLTRDAKHYRRRFGNAIMANDNAYIHMLIGDRFPLETIAGAAAKCGDLNILNIALCLGATVEGNEDICLEAAMNGYANVVHRLMMRGVFPPLSCFDALALKGELTVLKCLMAERPVWREVVWEHRGDYSPQVLAWIAEGESD
jgi:hypothetical protein